MANRTFTIIGAGGIFTFGLLAHLGRLAEQMRAELAGTRIRLALVDIEPARLDRVVRFGRRVVLENGLADRVEVAGCTSGEDGCDSADLVLLIRPFRDEEARNVAIAGRHGVPGGHEGPACLGLARFCLPGVEAVARTLQRRGRAGARLIVFPNPTDALAQAVQIRTGLETWGWCGAPDSLRETMAEMIGVDPARVTRLRSVGVNHHAYVTELEVDGQPGMARLQRMCAARVAETSSARVCAWCEWVRDTGWPYVTLGHPAPWVEPLPLPVVWTNTEAPSMQAVVDEELAAARLNLDRLIAVFGWEGTTGFAMVRLMGALWGQGTLEVGWQSRHPGSVPGLPHDAWVERTMRVERGMVGEVDFQSLPEGMEAQLRLLVLQQRAFSRALAADDQEQALRALALNPFSCPMHNARPYVREIWGQSVSLGA